MIERGVKEALSAIVSLSLTCDSRSSQSASILATVFTLDSKEEIEGHFLSWVLEVKETDANCNQALG